MLNRHLLFLYGVGLLICTAVGCGLFGMKADGAEPAPTNSMR